MGLPGSLASDAEQPGRAMTWISSWGSWGVLETSRWTGSRRGSFQGRGAGGQVAWDVLKGTSRRKGLQAWGHDPGDGQSSSWVVSIKMEVRALGERRPLRGSLRKKNWKEAGCAHGTARGRTARGRSRVAGVSGGRVLSGSGLESSREGSEGEVIGFGDERGEERGGAGRSTISRVSAGAGRKGGRGRGCKQGFEREWQGGE